MAASSASPRRGAGRGRPPALSRRARRLLAAAKSARGMAILIDWHSMPAAATSGARGAGGGEIVLGDRFGGPQVRGDLSARGTGAHRRRLPVARNVPYAGGYTTEHYGRPGRRSTRCRLRFPAPSISTRPTLEPTAGFATLKANLERLFTELAATDWARLAA